jgi:hypothetical protein
MKTIVYIPTRVVMTDEDRALMNVGTNPVFVADPDALRKTILGAGRSNDPCVVYVRRFDDLGTSLLQIAAEAYFITNTGTALIALEETNPWRWLEKRERDMATRRAQGARIAGVKVGRPSVVNPKHLGFAWEARRSGKSWRQIQEALKEVYGIDLPRSTISGAVRRMVTP